MAKAKDPIKILMSHLGQYKADGLAWPEIMVQGKATEMAKILWDCGLRFVDLGEDD